VKAAADLVGFLEARHVSCAVMGGAALAVHGVARATVDIDLLTAAGEVLHPGFWAGLGAPLPPEIRRGDADDPIAGVCRWVSTDPPVDLIVGKGSWIEPALTRREWLTVEGLRLPVVTAADLVLLKLAAGGPQDLLDVRLLLARDPGPLRGEVEKSLSLLPPQAAAAWASIVSS
jgi:hypothetical protein